LAFLPLTANNRNDHLCPPASIGGWQRTRARAFANEGIP
jgi:hypothetical protein